MKLCEKTAKAGLTIYNKKSIIYMYTTYTTYIKEAQQMNEIVNIENRGIISDEPLTADLFLRWTRYLDAKPKTVETYSKAIKQFLIFLKDNDINAPQREDVIRYRDQLKESHKPTTVQGYLMAVKLFFQWTEQEGIYPNIANRIKGAKLDPEHKKDYLTTKQVNKVLNSIDTASLNGLRDYAVLALMVTSGLRTIEVSRANIEDLRTVADSTVLYIQGKGRDEKTDYVKLAEPVEDAVRAYLQARGHAEKESPLFASIANRNNGERMTTRSISRIVKDRLIEAGFDSDRLTAHSLRHTAATLNLLNGGTVEETKQLLRHSNINTTLIYSHALERAKNDSENRIARAIFK
jgi:integrase/recombinase XerC